MDKLTVYFFFSTLKMCENNVDYPFMVYLRSYLSVKLKFMRLSWEISRKLGWLVDYSLRKNISTFAERIGLESRFPFCKMSGAGKYYWLSTSSNFRGLENHIKGNVSQFWNIGFFLIKWFRALTILKHWFFK